MNDASFRTLRRIAEETMVERGFLPAPPPEVLAEVAATLVRPDPAAAPDLRGLPWTSIDNVESRDLDQIEAADPVAGGTRLYVAIADVSHYVALDSRTDRFAAHNTTSVYTGVRTFPMLPDALSSDRSSLLAGAPRPALVIETLVQADGTLGEGKVYRAWVENHAKLDYPSVGAWLEGAAPAPGPLAAEPRLREQLELQDRLAGALADARRRGGALDVDTAEVRPVVDDGGRVTGFAPHHPNRAGRLVEELMIASNRTVARTLGGAGRASLRRVVREPERWSRIVSYAAERGFHLPATPSSLPLAHFVEEMRRSRTLDEFSEISLALIKLLGRGEYVAHVPGQPEIGHFGLATMRYTHATAPNRRYPDLITQRLLGCLIAGAPAPYSVDRLAALAAHCTAQEAAAQKVERRVHKSVAAMLLSPGIGHRFSGIVTGASPKGTYVRVLAPPVEGRIVRGEAGLRVGDKVQVRLDAVNVEKGYIDFRAE